MTICLLKGALMVALWLAFGDEDGRPGTRELLACTSMQQCSDHHCVDRRSKK